MIAIANNCVYNYENFEKDRLILGEEVIGLTHAFADGHTFYIPSLKDGKDNVIISYMLHERIKDNKVSGSILILDSPTFEMTNMYGQKVKCERLSLSERWTTSFTADLNPENGRLYNIEILKIRKAYSREVDKCTFDMCILKH